MIDGLPIIGLTGGIGAGKSVVAKILTSLGCVVADADANVKKVLQENDIRQQLKEWWGDRVIDDSGQINRSEIAQIVFKDPDERSRLEALLHPRARELQDRQFQTAPQGTVALVIDAPLLMEVGMDDQCDVVIFIDAPRAMRHRRVLETRGWDAKELDRREVTQLSLDMKRKKADYTVTNAGDVTMVRSQIESVLADILAKQFEKN